MAARAASSEKEPKREDRAPDTYFLAAAEFHAQAAALFEAAGHREFAALARRREARRRVPRRASLAPRAAGPALGRPRGRRVGV